MPPKKKQVEEKAKKIVEDKTFGLKNKKGAKAQKFIQQVQKSTQNQQKNKEADARQKKKTQKEAELKELNAIFKPVISKQKIEAGVDPKSILCAFFKQGQCTKGDKCKFSHDISIANKSAKKSIFVDSRDINRDGEASTSAAKDASEADVPIETTADGRLKNFHICNHFLEAVENNKYGWFWVCPNGGDNCKYKHALPPGYKLKRDQKPSEDTREQTLEELLHLDKAKLNEIDSSKTEGTPLTLERFNEWKSKFVKEREKNKPKEKQFGTKKQTGKELFTFNPNLEADVDDGEGVSIYDVIDISNKQRHGENQEDEERNEENAGGDEEASQIDENLFDADDLGELDDELEKLDVNDN